MGLRQMSFRYPRAVRHPAGWASVFFLCASGCGGESGLLPGTFAGNDLRRDEAAASLASVDVHPADSNSAGAGELGGLGLQDELFVQVTERGSPVIVRSQPTTQSAERDQLIYGDRIVVKTALAGSADSGAPRWLQIKTGAGQEGYIASFLTNYSPVLGCLIAVDAPGGANLRQAPNLLSGVLRTVPNGQKLRLMGELFTDGDGLLNRWLRVRTSDGDYGFVSAQLTTYLGHLRNDTQPPGGECPFASERVWEAHGDRRLVEGVSAALEGASRSGTLWSAEVRYLAPNGKRRVLYYWNAETPVRPASNMKLLTGYLELLKYGGTDYSSRPNFSDFVDMMKYSINTAADRLAREALGARYGSELNGRALQRLKSEGYEPGSGFAMLDGSGLSYDNKLSARFLVQMLRGALQDPFRQVYAEALPVAGQDGTLAGRPLEGFRELRAKTGTLLQDPASALSGYARCVDGTGQAGTLIFSFMGDGVTAADRGHRAIDNALRVIARQLKTWPG